MAQALETQYAAVPAAQRELFLNFRRDHPYTSISFQNQTGRYIACGQGDEALVFLHGALVEPDMWFYPILELESQFRIIAPHFPPDRMGLLDAVALIRAAMDAEGLTTATFIGMSYGGGVAQWLAETHPEMIHTLVLTHTGLLGRAGSAERTEKLKRLIRFVPLFLIKAMLKRRVADFPSSQWNAYHRAYFLGINERITKRTFGDYLDSMRRFTNETQGISTDHRSWKGRTVLLGTRGDEDAFQYFEDLERLYPQAETHIFEAQGGHHMMFLFPEEYADILCRYVTQNRNLR
jgi:pimeloyl-ACP methyl ester carboxylesterase